MGGGGSSIQPTAGNANDICYTRSKDGAAVYAIVLGWPGTERQAGEPLGSAVTTSRFLVGSGKVFLFGPDGGSAIGLPFTQIVLAFTRRCPPHSPSAAVAYAMKISESASEPAPPRAIRAGTEPFPAAATASPGSAAERFAPAGK